jgi:hypothetical protein
MASSVHLEPQRKTWAAVLLTPENMREVYQQMPRALAEFNRMTGADEFHFAEILSGKRMREVPLELRLNIFNFMAQIFEEYQFPILVQTIGPAFMTDHQKLLNSQEKMGPFSMRKASDIGLMLLVQRIRHYIWQNKETFYKPAFAIADEGDRFKSGTILPLGEFADFAVCKAIFFAPSNRVMYLQLADFAAFAVNRVQWILANDCRSDIDEALLAILNGDRLNVVNLPKVVGTLGHLTREEFDTIHEENRKSKGLNPVPGAPPPRGVAKDKNHAE